MGGASLADTVSSKIVAREPISSHRRSFQTILERGWPAAPRTASCHVADHFNQALRRAALGVRSWASSISSDRFLAFLHEIAEGAFPTFGSGF
jgi:hypothetical protein